MKTRNETTLLDLLRFLTVFKEEKALSINDP